MSEEDKEYIGDCLKSFTYIGVRDQETENLVKMCLPEATVYRNCDPTVLLDKPKESQARAIKEKLHLDPQKKIVSIMMARYEPIIYDIIRKLGKKEYQFVYFYLRMGAWERFNPNSPRFLYNLSPYEWYLLYRNVYINFTSFFHGTLLALKSNVPTVTFDTTQIGSGYITKIEQLLMDFSLSDYFNSYQKGIIKEQIMEEVEKIMNRHEELSALIEESMSEEAQKATSFFERLDKAL